MHTVHTIAALHQVLANWRKEGRTVALVPTMGNLHQGHLELVRHAQGLADRVVVTLFVNPLQFAAGEDYHRYPRTLEADSQQLVAQGADLLFAPTAHEIYPRGMANITQVTVPKLGDILCGASRPGHFTGVATVVNLLFNLVQPQLAVFGEKDCQQLLIIRRMVADLHLPITIIPYPTVRESDGLAMSSRNGYLSPAERRQAPALAALLRDLAEAIKTGATDWLSLEEQARQALIAAGFKPDYCTIRRGVDLAVPEVGDQELVILAAAWLGQTRLIDNLVVKRSLAPRQP